jgi:tRNA-splicing ligase RtcB
MDLNRLKQLSEYAWEIERQGAMRVPAVIYGDGPLLSDMDNKVYEQAVNVATLPGIVRASYAMPDAHWGYGFPIGGVAAFDADDDGVVSAGGVGFDISCGVRTLHTRLKPDDIETTKTALADALYANIPVGVGSTGHIRLDDEEMDAMLSGGAQWAVERGYGQSGDLARVEETGRMRGALPAAVSNRAKKRQREEMGDGDAGFGKSLPGTAAGVRDL